MSGHEGGELLRIGRGRLATPGDVQVRAHEQEIAAIHLTRDFVRNSQHLQWRAPGSHWVLKTGQHNLALDTLLDTYPNAGIIVTHRDPVKIATSFTSLSTLLRSMGSDHVDGRKVAGDWCPRLALMFDMAMRVRDSGKYPVERFYDMHFRDLVGNWRGVVERIYDQFGLDLKGDAVDAMGRFMDANKQGKDGKHTYAPEQYGIDVPTERERFRRYTDRYGIEAEK